MLLVRFPVNTKLLVIKYLVSQKLHVDFRLLEIGALNPHIIQRSTVLVILTSWGYCERIFLLSEKICV